MGDKSVWDKEITGPVKVIQYIDPGVQKKVPPGTKLWGISPSGHSYWARTAKIDATDKGGNATPFFIKVHQNEIGKAMVSAEYEAMKALYSVMPEMVAEPLGWGPYEAEPDTWFFICRYCELSGGTPDASDFPALVAEMHSRGSSTKGEFGFPVVAFGGRNPSWFPVTNSWEETFSRGLARTFELEEETHGPDEEMRRLRDGIMTRVVPRLLRPLETEGRKLVPTLVHDDLWDGNASVDVNTGRPVIFDATPLYAHNEYEIAPWWPPRHQVAKAGYIEEYLKHRPKSEPQEDFIDRDLLYSLRFDVHASSLYPGNLRFRNIAKETMRQLLEAYPLGCEGYRKEQKTTGAARSY